MIPLAVPNLNGNEKKYLDNCIDTTFVSSVGEYVTRLENDIKNYTHSSDAVATSSGTTGLHASLISVGVKYSDLVIIPTFTFIATANSVAHCGAVPWLFDISGKDWCLDPDLVAAELKKECEIKKGQVIHKKSGRRVAAIMPVYTLGNIPDMKAFRLIADEWNLPLIADAACAIGASYYTSSNEQYELGEIADLSVISFNGNKTITCGGGGAVIGTSSTLLNHVRHLTTTARVWPDYDFDEVGFNYRMTNIQAAVGVAQMERVEAFVKRKREVRDYYKEALKDIQSVSFFPETNGASCWYSGIVLSEEATYDTAKKICLELKEYGIEARTFWKPVHIQKPYINCPRTDIKVANNLWQRIVTLPCSTNIMDEDLKLISTILHSLID